MSRPRATALALAGLLSAATLASAAAPARAATPACTTTGPQVYCSMAWARNARPTLAPGAAGDDVAWLQRSLRALGATVGVTARYDAATTSAVRSYQTTRRLPVTGTYDATMQRYLVAGVGPRRPAAHPLRRNAAGPVLLGRSVQGRDITAQQVGDPTAVRTVLLIGQVHGNETAGTVVARTLLQGPRVEGISLWVVPSLNPDGLARGTRTNAHGVDLNRNWPWSFVVQKAGTGQYSGPSPLSEPENRALRDFILTQGVDLVVVLHQPYDAVDAYDARTVALRDAISRNLGLPVSSVDCPGGCHGTFMQWVHNATPRTVGITVEFGASPSTSYLTGQATRGLVAAVGGRLPA